MGNSILVRPRFKLGRILFGLIAITILCLCAQVDAAVINAASCSQTDVQAALDLAQDGDVVSLPIGTGTWTTPAVLGKGFQTKPPTYVSKNITIKGAGIDKTIIIDNIPGAPGTNGLSITGVEGKPIRITGITFDGSLQVHTMINITGSCKNFRVDHCKFINCGRSLTPVGNVAGVMDHCEIYQYEGYHVTGFSAIGTEWDDTWAGNNAWKRPLTLGTAKATYVEDCYFYFPHDQGNGAGDNYMGARYVFRHNNVIGADVGCHGLDSGTRSTFSWEIYENTFLFPDKPAGSTYTHEGMAMGSRGGTGVMFNNTLSGNYDNSILLQSYRSMSFQNLGMCDGANPVDGNMAIESGVATGPSSSTTLICAGKNWTPNQWRGFYAWNLSDHNSKALVISNTADTITALFINILAENSNAEVYTNSKTMVPRVANTTNWATNQWVGYTAINQLDMSLGPITANDATTFTADLSGGKNNNWNGFGLPGDYKIVTSTPPAGFNFKWNPGDSFKLSNGYPCLDQNGYTTLIEGTTGQPQKSAPIYEWGNLNKGVHKDIVAIYGPRVSYHVVENRDYFNQKSPFDGSAGTGAGLMVNRPATCTQGVGYWASDVDNSNGGKGILYQCSAPNTWTEYYSPYTYPHPLVLQSNTFFPSDNTLLRITNPPNDDAHILIAIKSSDSRILFGLNNATHQVALKVQFPSGAKDVTFNQLVTDPAIFYATVDRSFLTDQDLALTDGSNIGVISGSNTVTGNFEANVIHPNFGGKVVINGTQVIIQSGKLTREGKIQIVLLGEDLVRKQALAKKNLTSLGAEQEISFISNGTVSQGTIKIGFDRTLLPAGAKDSNLKIAYYNPSTGDWEVQDKTTVEGNSLVCDVAHFSIYKPVYSVSVGNRTECFAFPNPAHSNRQTIRMFLGGSVDAIDLTIYDISGRIVHSVHLAPSPSGTIDNNIYYDYEWNQTKGSGVYHAVAQGKRSDGSKVSAKCKFAVVK